MNDTLSLQLDHLRWLESAYGEVMDNVGYDAVLIFSGRSHAHFGDDQHPAFTAFGHFLHWVPLPDMQSSWLVVQPGLSLRLQVHAPADFWHLPLRLPEEPWAECFHVEYVCDDRPPRLPEGRVAVIGEVSAELAATLAADLNPDPLCLALDELRVCKSAYEIACLRHANRQALRGHDAARLAFLDGDDELSIHLAYLVAVRQREATLPYQSIVGINEHAGVLHYQHYASEAAAKRHAMLIDAGYRFRGYGADISRTWTGPDAVAPFAVLVEELERIKYRLIALLRPGLSFVEVHDRMHAMLGELLVDQGLVHCSAEAAVSQGITRAFCPHGVGHLLGLQVHDVAGRRHANGTPLPPPSLSPALRLTRELDAEMVVTVEPGLYFIPMLLEPLRDGNAGKSIDWTLVERLIPHGGIRTEDNIRITPQRPDNLTALPGDG
ncbi:MULTISPECIES: Xaa-Pro dipeptidase [Halomonadaceae]|uniref:Xaa-Pro dipeptidase n=1 Tax=Halomonadaceae TaxID=28256 RepID=UPI001598C91D|nr:MULTISPECIES: Xaa-Pro dipeptidase [Halomonas]QJQ96648.1 Xaa-Pro dipeptidase [Halomonas sp. PA5]